MSGRGRRGGDAFLASDQCSNSGSSIRLRELASEQSIVRLNPPLADAAVTALEDVGSRRALKIAADAGRSPPK
jgi:hypothetical protein